VSRVSRRRHLSARHRAYEKRNIALEIPVWEPTSVPSAASACSSARIAAIRARALRRRSAGRCAADLQARAGEEQGFPAGTHISYQVAPEDCTGCGDCVEACPIHDKSNVSRNRAVNMAPIDPLRDQERDNLAFFLRLPEFDRA
jgi:pyruvate-ferredoxin/flavodoxin oxidoreductase